MKLLVDINVILDVLGERQPWFADSAAVISMIETPGTRGCIAAHSVTTLVYLLTRHLGRLRANAVLLDLLDSVEVVPLNRDLLLQALTLGWEDAEDAVQAVSALGCSADYIITRNTADFRESTIPALTPTELLAILGSREA